MTYQWRGKNTKKLLTNAVNKLHCINWSFRFFGFILLHVLETRLALVQNNCLTVTYISRYSRFSIILRILKLRASLFLITLTYLDCIFLLTARCFSKWSNELTLTLLAVMLLKSKIINNKLTHMALTRQEIAQTTNSIYIRHLNLFI